MHRLFSRATASSPVSGPRAKRGTRIFDREEVFRWIVGFKQEHDGNSPTIREIQLQFKMGGTSVALHILKQLERRGRIRLASDGRSRQISVVGGSWCLQENATQHSEVD